MKLWQLEIDEELNTWMMWGRIMNDEKHLVSHQPYLTCLAYKTNLEKPVGSYVPNHVLFFFFNIVSCLIWLTCENCFSEETRVDWCKLWPKRFGIDHGPQISIPRALYFFFEVQKNKRKTKTKTKEKER